MIDRSKSSKIRPRLSFETNLSEANPWRGFAKEQDVARAKSVERLAKNAAVKSRVIGEFEIRPWCSDTRGRDGTKLTGAQPGGTGRERVMLCTQEGCGTRARITTSSV